MKVLIFCLLAFLIVCAVSVSLTKKLLTSIIIYMSFSLIMSIVWISLQSPDLAITEAAVGAGVTSILFFVTLKKIRVIDEECMKKTEDASASIGSVDGNESPEGEDEHEQTKK